MPTQQTCHNHPPLKGYPSRRYENLPAALYGKPIIEIIPPLWPLTLTQCASIDTVCVKKNKHMLDSLKEQEEIKGDYHFLIANVTKLPFKAGSFDKIICSEVLEHIPEDKIAVEELIRVLGKDGAIGISVPHYLAESICWKLSRDYYGFPGGHIRKYKTRDFLELVDTTGLSVYTIRHKHAPHSFYWLFTGCFAVFSGSKKKMPRSPPCITDSWNGTYALTIMPSAAWNAY